MAITIENLTTTQYCQNLIGPAAQNASLSFLISAASTLITQSCNRPFWLNTNAANPIMEYIGGSGDPYLPLGYWPVQSITSIYLDNAGFWGQTSGSFASACLLNSGTDYALELDSVEASSKCAIVLRINGVWDSVYLRDGGMLSSFGTNGQGNVMVTYTYGYSSIPADIQWAATMLVGRMLLATPGQVLNATSIGEFSASYENWLKYDKAGYGILTGEIEGVLAKYRIMPMTLCS